MAMKKGLGRGLDALLEPLSDADLQNDKGRVLKVSIDAVDTNREQPRKSFHEDSLKELSDSIKVHGIVQPLIVKRNGERYTIVAGERRYRAARLAKLKTLPVLVVDYDDEKLGEISLIENIQRENLNPIEEAAAVRFLMKQHDLTQDEVADKLGKSRPAVANSLRLLNLPDSIMEMVRTGVLSAGHGRALSGVKDKELQLQLAGECQRLGYSVRALESRIKNLQNKKPQEKKNAVERSQDIIRAEKNFRSRLGTKVKIDGSEQAGRIIIEYFSADDLQNIYAAIVGDEQ